MNIKPIIDGDRDGEKVWICDLRYSNLNEKAIRKVVPTLVEIVSNSETTMRVNYSHSHFRKFNAKGKRMAQVIKLFDNTGYRSFSGVALQVFETEAECVAHWNQRCDEVAAEFKQASVYQAAALLMQHDRLLSSKL